MHFEAKYAVFFMLLEHVGHLFVATNVVSMLQSKLSRGCCKLTPIDAYNCRSS